MSPIRACTAVLLILVAASAFADTPKEMTVTVKETQIRATPSFLGKILDKLAYGAKVQVIAIQNGWVKIALPSGKGEGWVNLSAVTENKTALKAGEENVSQNASSGEVALAGKGFTQEVENKYKEDQKLDYSWVDRMGQYVVPPEEVVLFLKQGGLSEALGGGQ